MFLIAKKNKLIPILLVAIFFFAFFTPLNSIHAQGVPTMDVIVEENTTLINASTKSIAAILAGTLPGAQQDAKKAGILTSALKTILRQFTQSIVTWIDNGFKGNPAFITNTGRFLQNTADVTIGDFLMNDPSLNFLCDPFKLQIKLALGLQYRPFKDQIKCSFTSALGNVNDAMNKFTNGDFIGGGGWDAWLQMTTVPQNNQMGAMMIAQNELDARLSGNKEIKLAEANWGGGFMSWTDCENVHTVSDNVSGDNVSLTSGARTTTNDATGQVTTSPTAATSYIYRNDQGEVVGSIQNDQDCTIKTPGSVIANKINWSDTSNIRELELANDFNAIVNALANQVLLKGMGSLSASGLLGNKKIPNNNYVDNTAAYLNSIQAQLDAQNGLNGSNTGTYNSDGSINFNQSFANKAVALDTINSQTAIENQYLSAQSNIYSLLDAAQNAFASSNCNQTVKDGITAQITGNYTGIKDLTWNKADITRVSTTTINNISTLNTVANSVQNTTNDSAVPGIVAPLTTMNTLHSAATVSSYSPSGTFYNQIKNWIVNQINSAANSCTVSKSGLAAWGIQ